MKLKDFDFRVWSNTTKQYYKPNIELVRLSVESGNFDRIPAMTFTNENKEHLDTLNLNLSDLEIELCTELKDINNKKIYEGDILRIKGDFESVIFENGKFVSRDDFWNDTPLVELIGIEIEVVGNCHIGIGKECSADDSTEQSNCNKVKKMR